VPLTRRSLDAWLSPRQVGADAAVTGRVAQIIDDVRRRGDAAVRDWTARLDGVLRTSARVEAAAAARALREWDAELKQDVEVASRRIRTFAEAIRPRDIRVGGETLAGVDARLVWEPLRRVAVYVPGGRHPLVSSLLMGVVTAQAAGVPEVAVFTPPEPTGEPASMILAAAAWLGVSEIYAVGGVQAVAAAAYGTESIRPVEALVGPGNRWVTEAKRQVRDVVRIDGLAGPSEVVVWGEPPADPRQAALDLLAQAEHDPDSWAIVLSTSDAWLDAVDRAVTTLDEAGLTSQAGVGAARPATPEEALSFINAFAPEHVELWGGAAAYAGGVRDAGATFVACPTPLGDYVAGPNHVLPTGGAARRDSVLTPYDFLRARTEVRRDRGDLGPVAAAGARLAAHEGLGGHERALRVFLGALDQ
jgi:histidinol dehydrogenase